MYELDLDSSTPTDFLKTLKPNDYVVVFMGSCSMGNTAEGHLRNERLCTSKIKKVYQYPTNYAVELKI